MSSFSFRNEKRGENVILNHEFGEFFNKQAGVILETTVFYSYVVCFSIKGVLPWVGRWGTFHQGLSVPRGFLSCTASAPGEMGIMSFHGSSVQLFLECFKLIPI